MKVLLVYPRLIHQVHGLWAPLGPMILGAVLEDNGHRVIMEDASFDVDTSRIEARIAAERPDVVGVTVLTEFLPATRNVLRAAKLSGAKTALGGPHPTILPEDTLRKLPDADFVVVGEGEITFPALLDAVGGGDTDNIPGVVYRNRDSEIVMGPPRPMIENLDSVPIPRRESIPNHERYLKVGALNIHAVRGCPYRCSFCQPTLNKLFGKKIRSKSPEAVADEVDWTVRRYGVKELFFVDDVFTISKRWLTEVGNCLKKRPELSDVRYVINSRVDIFDEELARLCKDMGAWIVLFGVESGSQEVLDYLNKGATVDQARRAFSICKKIGLKTHAYILLGSPAETRESLRATEELVAELNPDSVHISICAPLPGTELRERMEREGRLAWKDMDDLDYYTPRTQRNELPISNIGVTYEEVVGSREKILAARRPRLLIRNAIGLASDLIKPGGIAKAGTRLKYYRRMRHYFG